MLGIPVEMIPAKALDGYIDDPCITILDVRTAQEYQKSHIRGAVNVPYCSEQKYWEYIPPNKKYVVYCDRGATSLMVARMLAEKGIRAATVMGGINAYRGTNFVDTDK